MESTADNAYPASVLATFVRSLVGGFLMGTADLIPGVSGGTIALVLGIYRRLVSSIKEASSALGSILRLDLSGVKEHLGNVEWRFLLPLLVGIGTAVVLLSSFIENQLEARPIILSAAFFGLVIGSVVVAWRMIESARVAHFLIAALMGAVLFTALGLSGSETATTPGLVVFFAAGALAVCAMILPGISGSLILVLVGMYAAALSAVTARDLAAIVALGLGAVVGLALFSQVLHWALTRHHDTVVAAMVGLMLGSLRILWPWPDGVESAVLDLPGADWPWAMLAALIGVAVVFVISRLAEDQEALRRQHV